MTQATSVLIVDDEASIREILRRSLARAGYGVREAADSLEASRAFLEHDVDAVILDLRMPELSGFRFLDWLRSEPSERAQTVPVFVLTGQPLTDEEGESLRRRHVEVFFKPQGIEEILKALVRAVGR